MMEKIIDKIEYKRKKRDEIRDSLANNRFRLPRDSEQRERITKIREIANDFAANYSEFVSLQIFGSLIKGYAEKESDIDAYVIIGEEKMSGGKKNLGSEALDELKAKMMENLNLLDEQVKHVSLKMISEESIKGRLIQAPWMLYYLFYPSIGTTKIRQYRKIIFGELKGKGELGERIWQSIMDRLCLHERGGGLGGMKSKHLYPQTLTEGEKRFL